MAASVPPLSGSPVGVTAWRSQLRPWLNALRDAQLGLALAPLATVSDMEKLWIDVHAPANRRTNTAEWTLLTEGLELIELLARVEQRAAWQLLFETGGRPRMLEMYGNELLPRDVVLLPRFVIHIAANALQDATEATIRGCARLLIAGGRTSATYGDVKQALLDAWRTQHAGLAFDRETEGRVTISLNFSVNIDYDNEATTGLVFSAITHIADAHSDLSLVERVNRGGHTDEEVEGSEGEVGGGDTLEPGEPDAVRRPEEATEPTNLLTACAGTWTI